MLKFNIITLENIIEEDIRAIYEWRFQKYVKKFITQNIPTLSEHRIYLLRELNNNNINWFGLKDDEKLIACCSAERSKDDEGNKEITLGRVMVEPKRRREKLGSKIIDDYIQYEKGIKTKYKLKLQVLMSNEAALKLYKKKGFICVSRKEEMIYMEKMIG